LLVQVVIIIVTNVLYHVFKQRTVVFQVVFWKTYEENSNGKLRFSTVLSRMHQEE
jgi:hypothetical protein